MVKKKEISHGRLLIYLILVIVAVFMISKLDITGMASKTKIEMIPTITAGETIKLNINTGNNAFEQGIDVYKDGVRYCQDCFDVCKSSKCKGSFVTEIDTGDNWVNEDDDFEKTMFSLKIYEWQSEDFEELFFYIKSKYEPAGVKLHR